MKGRENALEGLIGSLRIDGRIWSVAPRGANLTFQHLLDVHAFVQLPEDDEAENHVCDEAEDQSGHESADHEIIGRGDHSRVQRRKSAVFDEPSAELSSEEVNRRCRHDVGDHLDGHDHQEIRPQREGDEKCEDELGAENGEEGDDASHVNCHADFAFAEFPKVGGLAGCFGEPLDHRPAVQIGTAWERAKDLLGAPNTGMHPGAKLRVPCIFCFDVRFHASA